MHGEMGGVVQVRSSKGLRLCTAVRSLPACLFCHVPSNRCPAVLLFGCRFDRVKGSDGVIYRVYSSKLM